MKNYYEGVYVKNVGVYSTYIDHKSRYAVYVNLDFDSEQQIDNISDEDIISLIILIKKEWTNPRRVVSGNIKGISFRNSTIFKSKSVFDKSLFIGNPKGNFYLKIILSEEESEKVFMRRADMKDCNYSDSDAKDLYLSSDKIRSVSINRNIFRNSYSKVEADYVYNGYHYSDWG